MWSNLSLPIPLGRAVLMALVAAFAITGAPVRAQQDNAAPDPRVLLRALVGIEADIPSGARTAPGLGTHREGNGVVISEDGLVLTIGYLILEAASVDITLQNGREVAAEVVAYDHDSGFGLVRATQALGIDPIQLGDSAAVLANQRALVATRNGVSDALGVRVVSRRVFSGSWEYMIEDAIFTSPPHRQFAGAALIGAEGKLIGIGSLFVGNAGNEDKPGNMFVPINEIKPILQELVDNGRRTAAPRPWLGVYPEPLQGFVFISRVAEGGPAEGAGVRAGDLVVEVDGVGVGDVEDFYRSIWATGDAGTTIDLTLLSRGGQLREITIPSIDRR
ncbi:MAG: S1C family serine protease, partial [Alphaproteobacteria bacterium]